MNNIYIFSNVQYPESKKIRSDNGDILVFLNTAVSAEYYRSAPAARKILFRRRGLETFGRELDFCENYNIEKGDISPEFIRGLKKNYNWNFDSMNSTWRGMTTGYIVTKYLQSIFIDWKINLVNFGYDVLHSTERRKDHNWKFEAEQLAGFKHIYTAETNIPQIGKRKILYITGGHLGDSVYASAIAENIYATGQYELNILKSYPGVWDKCDYLNRTINSKNADFIIRNEYLALWRNGCPSLIEGVQRVIEQKIGISIPRIHTKPIIYADLDQERFFLKKYIVICTGFLPSCQLKNWGNENWIKLISLFPEYIFVQAGNSKGNSNPLPGCINLIDQTDFNDLCRLIRDAACVIAPPNGLIHIAAALDVPSIALSGGREPESLIDYPSCKIMSACGKFYCCRRGGCRKNTLESCEQIQAGIPACMNYITPEMVKIELEKILENTQK